MFKEINQIQFPTPSGANINMMPIIFGDIESLPKFIRPYQELINNCKLEKGSKAYLTITESDLVKGQYQRRPGIHTDGVKFDCHSSWGKGTWGGIENNEGIYMASSDGRCRIWNTTTNDVDKHGSLLEPKCPSVVAKPSTLYWMTDQTPHESLHSLSKHTRQFFRLVTDNIFAWWVKHSTPNPLGILPNARIESGNKYV